MQGKRRISFALTFVAIFQMVLTPWAQAANAIIERSASSGQADGQSILEQSRNSFGTGELPPSFNGDTNMLYPGLNPTQQNKGAYFFNDPSLVNGDVAPDKTDYRNQLYQDAQKGSNATIEGQAYSILSNTATLDRPNLSSDAMLKNTRDVMNNLDEWVSSFSDCRKQQQLLSGAKTTHIPDLRTCRKRVDMTKSCKITHEYSADILLNEGGTGGNTDALSPCPGEKNCYQFQIGIASGCPYYDQRCLDRKAAAGVLHYERAGSCYFFSAEAYVRIVNPEAITRAVLAEVGYDDHIKLMLDGDVIYQNDQHLMGRFPPIDKFRARMPGYYTCEHSWWGGAGNSVDWRAFPVNKDVTRFFKKQPGQIVTFRMETADGDRDGRFTAKIKIYFDRSKAFKENWGPEDCIKATAGYFDGYATGSVTCTKMPSSLTAEGCARTGYGGGVPICPNELTMPWPLDSSNISKLCQEITVDVNYNTQWTGIQQPCYKDVNGNTVCPTVSNKTLQAANDGCKEFETNQSCSYVSSECVEGMTGQTGQCYMQRRTYDCGYDVATGGRTVEKVVCDGEISCMGESCVSADNTNMNAMRQSFGEVTAALQALDMIKTDANCTKNSLTGQVSCNVFPGKVGYCRQSLGGIGDALGLNCCKDPGGGPSLGDYITAIKKLPELNQALMSMTDPNMFVSGYQSLAHGIAKTATPLTSGYENVVGQVKDFFKPVDQFIDEMKKKIQDQITNILGRDAATSGSGAVLGNGAGAAISQFTDMMQTFSTIYSYYALTKIALNLIYGCKKDEMITMINNRLRQCHRVGTYCSDEICFFSACVCIQDTTKYCCFNSPLARIIQEGIRESLGYSWGSAKYPECGGIPMERLKDADWSKVNWAEWEALLNLANLNYNNPAQRTMENLTGPANPIRNSDGVRPNARDRLNLRLDGVNINDMRLKSQEAATIDVTGRQ